MFGASDKAIGLLESGSDFEKRITQIYQECKTSDEFVKRFNSLEKEIDRKRNKKMDELRGLITKQSPDEHKRSFAHILAEIDDYKEQVEYWNGVPDSVTTGRFPKYMETNLDVLDDGSHGYLIIGGWYNDSQLISSVLAVCGEDNRVRKIPEAMSREVVSKLTDGCVVEKNCDTNSVGKVIEHVENLLYDDMCAGKVGELAANRRKMEVWLNYRKEEFLLNMKDTSYTWEMTCQAICKIEGFKYCPDGEYQGYSSENRYIHITEEFVNGKYIIGLTKSLGERQSVLIYCKKHQADMILPANVEVKKIPKDLLGKCSFESEEEACARL